MKIRGFLSLVAVISVLALSAPACTPASGDDDDDGFGTTQTPTPTTPTPTPTPTATPPAADITERSSFIAAGGTELWLCFEHQFAGTIDNVFTTEGGACEIAVTGLGLASTLEAPTHVALLIEGVTGCTTGSHDWQFDYVEDDERCSQGCVNQEYHFSQAASTTFGSFCGPTGLGSGATVITSLEAYLSATTAEHRFTAVIGPAGSVTLDKLRVYDQGGTALLTECTATATIISNGTGLFDTSCAPAAVLTPATTYSALVFGDVSGQEFIGRVDFDYVATP